MSDINSIVLVVYLAFPSGMMVRHVQTKSCQDFICTMGGSYTSGIDLPELSVQEVGQSLPDNARTHI